MRHDFFIHTSGLTEDERRSPGYGHYVAAIKEAAQQSESPISVSGGEFVSGLIPPERTIYTIPYQLEETGKISRDQAQKLVHILGNRDPADEFRIHGAYLGRCLPEFATQLYGLVYANEFWPDYPTVLADTDPYETLRMAHRERLRLLLTDNRFGESRIKYGVVFDQKSGLHVARNEFQQRLLDQLTDAGTLIY